jgi:hypothetical protein
MHQRYKSEIARCTWLTCILLTIMPPAAVAQIDSGMGHELTAQIDSHRPAGTPPMLAQFDDANPRGMLPLPGPADAANPSARKPIQGGISAYANAPSNVPLMQGNATESLPQQWRGVWKGDVRVGDASLMKEIPTTDNASQYLHGKAAQLSLNLGKENDDMQIPELTVSDKARGADPTPDIIFFHSGSHGHLWVLPGAHIFEHDADGTHSIAIGGNVFVGDGVHFGSSFGGGAPQIQHNNGGITFGGSTTFNDRYFKADDRTQFNDVSTITAGRVDLGAAKMYPNGQTIEVSGSSNDGYRLARPQNQSSQGAASPTNSLAHDTLKDAHPANSVTVMIAPGVYDQRTISPVESPDGKIVGFREMVARYTALSPDRMLVQISVANPDQTGTFSMSGYLLRQH